ncbi:MAG: lasso peptide biosynthesis PqqD family chaperone [Bacteroidales bacterium]|nr:lasso peptide biosynthesis PqqD family chaperone [Bacteroidales bacterium]
MKSFPNDKIIYVNTDLLNSQIDGETVMMSLELGKYFGLNEVGSKIWELIQTPKTLNKVVEQLVEIYEIDYATCLKETSEFLASLYEQKLIYFDKV